MRTWMIPLLAAGLLIIATATLPAQPPPPPDDAPLLAQGPDWAAGDGEHDWGRGPGGHGPHGPAWDEKDAGPVTPEMEKRVMDFLKKEAPSKAEKLEKLKASSPKRYEMWVRRGAFRLDRLEAMKDKDPEGYQSFKATFKTEAEVEVMADKVRKDGGDADRAALRAKVSELFDFREANKRHEIVMLQKKIDELQKTMEERKTNKVQIVEKHLKEIMGEKDSMEW